MDYPEDIARDEAYSEMYDEISSEAIVEFTFERLIGYVLDEHGLTAMKISRCTKPLILSNKVCRTRI